VKNIKGTLWQKSTSNNVNDVTLACSIFPMASRHRFTPDLMSRYEASGA